VLNLFGAWYFIFLLWILSLLLIVHCAISSGRSMTKNETGKFVLERYSFLGLRHREFVMKRLGEFFWLKNWSAVR